MVEDLSRVGHGREGGRSTGGLESLVEGNGHVGDAHFRLTGSALAKGGFGLMARTWSIEPDSGEPGRAPHAGGRSSRKASEQH